MQGGMAETLKLTPTESVEIRQSSPEVLEVEGRYAPGGKAPPAHFHPAQDEHFEVLEGTLRAKVGGEERDLGPGETLEIPAGTPHQMWNPGEQAARVIWQTRPALRTEQWFRSIDALHREGRVGRNGMPGPLAFGAFLSEFDDVFRLAGPAPLVRGAVAVLGFLGRARGYQPVTGPPSVAGPPCL
jgi:mannose-6-phosphate isomerase-like protein (cupin superfamily)